MRKGFLIYEEGLPHIWGNAQIFDPTYIRRPLVIHDFAPDPFWISLHMRIICHFSFQFFLCLGGGHFESADQLPQYSMTVQNQSSSGHVGPNIIIDTYKWIMVDLRFEIQ
jgi:hypothetical protein